MNSFPHFHQSNIAKSVALGLSLLLPFQLLAQTDKKDASAEVEKIEVLGSLGSLPGQDVETVFGFGKSLLETPRSASTISSEQLERFNVSDIDELVAFAPGTFTQSFFGVAGSLDVRGTPGETYFRGVKRLDNPGNYPTPIGASGRIDIVRGPASPIYGPSKIGGYLNFNPKSARASGGQYLEKNEGQFSYTTGTWDKSVLSAEVGGPSSIAGKEMGYYFYGEVENSGSYYENSGTAQTVLQASFNVDISDNVLLEFGGMHHKYDGNQIAGWNRLTQDLIDNGTYITGTAKPLDEDNDGVISHAEYGAVNIAGNSFFYVPASAFNDAEATDLMQLENVGTTTLGRNQVLVSANDLLLNDVNTLYLDVTYFSDDWTLKNQLFYEGYENLNENAYGFSQFHDSYVIENKFIASTDIETNNFLAQFQISPSVRYTNFLHGDDFTYEYFNRRDLTMRSGALDTRQLSTQINDNYDNYDDGHYIDYGLGALADLTWDFGLNLLLGLRYDTIDIKSTSRGDLLLNKSDIVTIKDTVDGISWNTSLSWKFDFGLIPYITAAEQSTVIAGQGAEIGVGQVEDGAFDTSELFEFGAKGSFLDDSLYIALASYKQKRTDFSAQAIVTNATTENKGIEFELRWVVTEQLVIGAGYTNIEVVNLTALKEGNQFGFLGIEDLVNLSDPSLILGGNVLGLTLVGNEKEARKAGLPENIYTFNATYDFLNGFALNGSIVHAEKTFSSFSQSVTLPSYTLVNTGVFYDAESWTASVSIKNVTDEKYFRANFPDLFGAQIVLPELPRHFAAKFTYKF